MCLRFFFVSQLRPDRTPNESLHTNRRHASPPVMDWRFLCAVHAQSSSPAAVGELSRSALT